MKKNDIAVVTRSVNIIVHINEYEPGDFTLTIENDNNKTKIIAVSDSDINRFSNTFHVTYDALNEFTLESLKITCKYPVKVRCDKFILAKCIIPELGEK